MMDIAYQFNAKIDLVSKSRNPRNSNFLMTKRSSKISLKTENKLKQHRTKFSYKTGWRSSESEPNKYKWTYLTA